MTGTQTEKRKKMTWSQRTVMLFAFVGLVLVLFSPKASLGFRFLATLGFLMGFTGAAFVTNGEAIARRINLERNPHKLGSVLLLVGALLALTGLAIFPAFAPYVGFLDWFPYWYWVLLVMSGLVETEIGLFVAFKYFRAGYENTSDQTQA